MSSTLRGGTSHSVPVVVRQFQFLLQVHNSLLVIPQAVCKAESPLQKSSMCLKALMPFPSLAAISI